MAWFALQAKVCRSRNSSWRSTNMLHVVVDVGDGVGAGVGDGVGAGVGDAEQPLQPAQEQV